MRRRRMEMMRFRSEEEEVQLLGGQRRQARRDFVFGRSQAGQHPQHNRCSFESSFVKFWRVAAGIVPPQVTESLEHHRTTVHAKQ